MVDAIGKMYFQLGIEQPRPNAFADMLKSMFTPQPAQLLSEPPTVVEDLEMD